MTILLTGGTGKTSTPLAHRLSDRTAHTVLLASRKGIKPETLSGINHDRVHSVTFDWYDHNSWQNPFDYVTLESLSQIDSVYLVAPFAWDVTIMNDFIDFAREKGVNKFVLLSASQAEAGDPSLGQVHAHLKRLSTEHGVQWVVIRPTWFIENLGEYQVESIRNHDTIESVWEDGKAPFVSAEDIAELVYRRLADWKIWNVDVIIHGPELFSNDEVYFMSGLFNGRDTYFYQQLAHLLSETLGRKITHKRISKEEYIQQWRSIGYEELARGLIDGELRVAQGSEQRIFKAAGAVQGTVSLRDYVTKNKHKWMNDGAIFQRMNV